MKIRVYRDEYYPYFWEAPKEDGWFLAGDLEIEVTQEELEWIRQVQEDVLKLQRFFKEKYEKEKNRK